MSSRLLSTIILNTTLTVSASRVASAQTPAGDAGSPPRTAIVAPSAPAVPFPANTAPRPMFFVQSDADDSVLEGREANQWEGKKGWRPWCAAPCAVPIVGGYEFRVFAPRKVTSAPFVIPFGAPNNVYVRMASKPQKVTGIVLTSVGGAVTGVAGTLALAFASCSGELGCNRDSEIATLLLTAAGAGLLVTGIYLIVANRTDVVLSAATGASWPLGRGLAVAPSGLVF